MKTRFAALLLAALALLALAGCGGSPSAQTRTPAVDGGALLELSGNKTKIVFFKDAARHTVRVCGKYKNGVEFCEEIVV